MLSAGAVEPGLHAFADVVKRETGHTLAIQFNTGPQIAKRLADGDVYDILISPPPAIAQALKDGLIVAETKVPVGRVGAGIIVRTSARRAGRVERRRAQARACSPRIRSSTTPRRPASTSTGCSSAGASSRRSSRRSTRYPDGASVMNHVIGGKGAEIGFGAMTEIRIYEPKGLRLVGPLPADVQNYTSYEAAVMTAAKSAEAARAVLKVLASPAGKAAFVSGGVE